MQCYCRVPANILDVRHLTVRFGETTVLRDLSFSVEAGTSFGWSRWVDRSVSIDTFGASGPGGEVLAHFGISPEAVALRDNETIAELANI